MLLAIDVGNTNIKLGIFNGEKLEMQARLSTDKTKTFDQYALEFKAILYIYNFNCSDISNSVLSCVVPQLSYTIRKAVELITGNEPFEITPAAHLDINILIDNPETLGSDLAVSCVAVKNLYSCPAIVIGLGTATTFCVINNKCEICGGIIMPGVSVSLEALSQKTSLLPSVGFKKPSRVIGKNTDECMRSGSVIGTAAMIDAVCERIEEELGYSCDTIATGGLASLIIPSCKRNIVIDNTLILKGLKVLFDINNKSKY
ncbi:MAG: type III pantothenate kinase [Clostridiales bacterium]|nr:type III pantothenate kinase [Clostridiales bacterium]